MLSVPSLVCKVMVRVLLLQHHIVVHHETTSKFLSKSGQNKAISVNPTILVKRIITEEGTGSKYMALHSYTTNPKGMPSLLGLGRAQNCEQLVAMGD